MNKRERFLAFATFGSVDRVPRRADFVHDLRQTVAAHVGKDPFEYFDMDSGRAAGLRPPDNYVRPDYSRYYPDRTVGEEDFSIDDIGVGQLGHGFHHFTERISPLRNAQRFEELEQYPFPDNTNWLDDGIKAACEEAHAAGDYVKVFAGHMYESSWQVRGYEPFLMDLLSQRDWAELILDKFCERNVRNATAGAAAGCDCLATGDDVANQNAMMFDADLWRELMKPRWARVISAAREIKPDIPVWYHSDGNVWDILDDLVEIGITILNPVQPECMDPCSICKRFGKRLAFDGCIGTQTTFPFGTPEEMRGVVKQLSADLDALKGGLMLSPTHVLEPEVPPENVVAFFEACDRVTK